MYFNILSYLILIFSFTFVFGEIKLINVLFRHGDRAPGKFIKSCPNDPHTNETFYPFGLGGLTNSGKMKMYTFGKYLRSNYDEFLGPVYLPDQVEAISSDSPRARMSLQMTLAGLYPPCEIQQWNTIEKTNWQPFLTSFKPMQLDTIFVPQMCIEYKKEYDRVKESMEFKLRENELSSFMKELGKMMGRTSPISLLDMNHLYQTLAAEKAMNLSLPEWGNSLFPDGDLHKGAILQYLLYGYNEKLRRLSGGVILQKMVEDMKNVIRISNYKIHLYSGHELNIVMLLHALGLYNDIVPEFSSSIIIEFHEIEKNYYVKLLYYRGIPAKTEIMQIPGCSHLCLFDDFIKLLLNVIPTEEELKCKRIKRAAA